MTPQPDPESPQLTQLQRELVNLGITQLTSTNRSVQSLFAGSVLPKVRDVISAKQANPKRAEKFLDYTARHDIGLVAGADATGWNDLQRAVADVPMRSLLSTSLKRDIPALPVGMHVMSGPRAVGKTMHGLCLVLWARAHGIPAYYVAMAEPRTSNFNSLLTGDDAWEKVLSGWLSVAKGGILVLDSLTYLLRMLPASRLAARNRLSSSAAYEGGLMEADVWGALMHDQMAADAKVALIATFNTQLYPPAARLEGAAEGGYVLTTTTAATSRHRATRASNDISIANDLADVVAAILGYTRRGIGPQTNNLLTMF